jgi:hypothetical protein
MKRILLSLFLLTALPVMASHIVGGEFELLHVSGSTYRLNLIVYFDLIKGTSGARDEDADVSIYSKKDNRLMATVRLNFTVESLVSYTQIACSNGELRTNRLPYTALVNLSPSIYNDAQGYYVVWERCCRNYSITNIYSQEPGTGGISAGQTFYLEFPPVVKDGKPFVDSTPNLFPPLNDYACVGRPYYVDFRGTDKDGDSLVYTMVTPLNTKSAEALPTPSPAPYPDVKWRTDLGFSLSRITKGEPDLKISKNGLLTTTPKFIGLFVFAIRVEEFRNKVKIGETRRDFQLLVIDCPIRLDPITGQEVPTAIPPKIIGKELKDDAFKYDKLMSVTFDDNTTNEQRCIQVRVSDDDSKPTNDGRENISIRVVPLNFESSQLNSVLPSITTAALTNNSTADFTICFPQCPFSSVPYEIGIIAFDDACSLPLMDTLKVTVVTNPSDLPIISTDLVNTNLKTINLEKRINEKLNFNVSATDQTGIGTISLKLADASAFSPYGILFTNVSGKKKVSSSFIWDLSCEYIDPSKRSSFTFQFVATNDLSNCQLNIPDILNVIVKVLPPINNKPLLTVLSNNGIAIENNTLNITLGQSIELNLVGTDADLTPAKDNLTLALAKAAGKIEPTGYDFTEAKGQGKVSSVFRWKPDCSIFHDGIYSNAYQFKFTLTDDRCYTSKSDSTLVKVNIKDIDNSNRDFLPANVITPNGDGCNDYFAVEGFEDGKCEGNNGVVEVYKGLDIDAHIALPLDNCTGQFQGVTIVNRWGGEVFRSTSRKFRWYAVDSAAGVYYYSIKFSDKEYRGTISVRN